MMTVEDFGRAVDSLRRRGYSEAAAARLASLAGDVVELDYHGRRVVRDENGRVAGRIPAPRQSS
jgi:hypothetical protein